MNYALAEVIFVTTIAALLATVTGKNPSPCTAPALHVWPLGPAMQGLDILTNAYGTTGNVGVGSYQSAVGYDSTSFNGSPDSYITVEVQSYVPDAFDDYAFIFYINFADVTQGTILSLLSRQYDGIPSTTNVRKYSWEILNGDLVLNITDFGVGTIATGLVANTWYHVVLMRDKNQDYFSVLLDHSNAKSDTNTILKDLADAPTLFPADVTIGKDADGRNPLFAEMSCFQFVPCKSPFEVTYDANCIPAAWPSTTTSGTSTTTTATTTTTTATTTTTTATTTTTSTTTSTTSPTLSSEIMRTAIEIGNADVDLCMSYKLVANDVVIEMPQDVLGVFVVETNADCARQCSSNASCEVFTVAGTTCTLGINGPTVFGVGSQLYSQSTV